MPILNLPFTAENGQLNVGKTVTSADFEAIAIPSLCGGQLSLNSCGEKVGRIDFEKYSTRLFESNRLGSKFQWTDILNVELKFVNKI